VKVLTSDGAQTHRRYAVASPPWPRHLRRCSPHSVPTRTSSWSPPMP